MERDRYISNEDAGRRSTSRKFFDRGAVIAASPVEPIANFVNARDAVGNDGASVSRYLTPLAAFGAVIALAVGIFAGGNLLLNYGDPMAAFWGRTDTPLVTDEAFAGAVAPRRSERSRRTRTVAKASRSDASPETSEASYETSPEGSSVELTAEYLENREVRDEDQPQDDKRTERTKARKEMKTARVSEPEDLKKFVETIDTAEDN